MSCDFLSTFNGAPETAARHSENSFCCRLECPGICPTQQPCSFALI